MLKSISGITDLLLGCRLNFWTSISSTVPPISAASLKKRPLTMTRTWRDQRRKALIRLATVKELGFRAKSLHIIIAIFAHTKGFVKGKMHTSVIIHVFCLKRRRNVVQLCTSWIPPSVLLATQTKWKACWRISDIKSLYLCNPLSFSRYRLKVLLTLLLMFFKQIHKFSPDRKYIEMNR